MSGSRIALLGGPVFFALWFIAGQTLFFASGGDVDSGDLPGPDEYRGMVLSNSASVRFGATLLVLAAIALIWFAAGAKKRVESSHGLDLVPVVAITGVVILLTTQAGLMVGSVHLAEQAPEVSWSLYQLSRTLGFESFISTLLGAAAVTGLVFAADRSTLPTWFWWTTIAFGSVLVVGGLLEGFDITPDGRFAIFFAIWTFITGFALQSQHGANQADNSLPRP